MEVEDPLAVGFVWLLLSPVLLIICIPKVSSIVISRLTTLASTEMAT